MPLKSRAIPADTDPAAARVQWEIYRRMTPGRRMELALEMSATLRQFMAAGVRMRHSHYDDRQVKLAVIRLSLGDNLFRRVYPGEEIVP